MPSDPGGRRSHRSVTYGLQALSGATPGYVAHITSWGGQRCRLTTVKATEVPLEAAELCLRALGLAERAAGLAHPNILSDVAAGSMLLAAAGRAVLLNVDANLGTLKDAERKERYAAQRNDREASLRDAEAAVLRAIEARRS